MYSKLNTYMKVIKRNGNYESVSFDKVTTRISLLCQDLKIIDPIVIAQKVSANINDNVHTYELDELAAQICASMSAENPEYNKLASRIIISNNHKNTSPSFSESMTLLYNNKDINNVSSPLLSDDVYEIIMKNKEKLNNIIDYTRDYNFDYFAFKTLEKAYLFKVKGKVVERIQHLFMRVSLGIHKNDISNVIESYNYMSLKYFIHATPTLYHSGTPRPQCSSCFLLQMRDDSIDGIYKTLSDCAKISKWAGGIGIHLSNIRSNGSRIRGTNGISTGIIPMLRVFNNTAKYVNQCFTPDTIIYTKEGIREACDIKEGNEVITLDGTFKKILEIIKNYKNQEIMEYKIKQSLFSIKCTKQHQIYVLNNEKKYTYNQIRNHIISGKIYPEYKSAKNLTINDYVVFTIPNYIEDVDEENLEYFYIYGLCLMKSKIVDDNVNLKLNESDIWKVQQYLIKRRIPHILNNNTFIWRIKDDIFKNKNKIIFQKRVLDNKFINLPIHKIKSIINGIFNNNEIIFPVYEKDFISSIRYLLLRIGILGKGNFNKGYYNFEYPLELDKLNMSNELNKIKYNDYFRFGQRLYCKIEFVNKIDYDGDVYDFNVEENHNYTTDSGIVHNSGKRPGSFAIYIEPHHPDILDFLDLRKNHGEEEARARDLFLAMWISDLFMKKVKNDETWCLFDPDECPGLNDVYGDDYNKLYEKYEKEGKARKIIEAKTIWKKILDSQIETGVPYILFKDACNQKSNQKNLGTIKSSNLCAEIIQYSDDKESAVCNLCSISLSSFVEDNKFNHEKLINVVRVAVNNLNNIIEYNYYPIPETELSNKKHRPVGIGVQGLADVFFKLKIPFDSEEAIVVNRNIFESLYYGALKASCALAEKYGSYETFKGSPLSQGLFQFDLWNVKPSNRWDWNSLRNDITKYGVRNSLLIALMPTASTSQILGNNETMEPITSNIYVRSTIAGQFIICNKYLVDDLTKLGIWDKKLKDIIVANNGSIQNIEGIPNKIKNLYKTAWELKQKSIVDLAISRGPYICQTQSMNLFFEEPSYRVLTNALFYGWKHGLKTGCYYIRSRPKIQAQQFTVDPELLKNNSIEKKKLLCSIENPESCEMCGS